MGLSFTSRSSISSVRSAELRAERWVCISEIWLMSFSADISCRHRLNRYSSKEIYIQTHQEACMCSTYTATTCHWIKHSILFKIINDWLSWEEIFWQVSGKDRARLNYFLQRAKMQNSYTYVSCYVQCMLPVSAVVMPRFAYFWAILQSTDMAEGPVSSISVSAEKWHHWPPIICCLVDFNTVSSACGVFMYHMFPLMRRWAQTVVFKKLHAIFTTQMLIHRRLWYRYP